MKKDKAIKIFKALSGETSFLIVKTLLKKEHCACEIPRIIKRAQSNTSMHLSKLLNLGIIEVKREGRKMIYSIKDKDVKIIMELIK